MNLRRRVEEGSRRIFGNFKVFNGKFLQSEFKEESRKISIKSNRNFDLFNFFQHVHNDQIPLPDQCSWSIFDDESVFGPKQSRLGSAHSY